MAGGDRSTRRPGRAGPGVLLGLYIAGLVLFCVAAVVPDPGGPVWLAGVLAAWRDPRGWGPAALQLGLGLLALLAHYLPRRHEARSFPLLVTGALGLSTVVLGVFGGWRCAPTESPFFAPLTMALGLLLGATPTIDGLCRGEAYPLALQLGRLLGPLLLLVTALGVAARLFRTQLDRLAVRSSPALAVVVGLSDEALPLVRRLAADLPGRTRLAVLVPDPEGPLVGLTRRLGGRVVACDPTDAAALRLLTVRRRRFKVRALYLVSADVSANLAWAEQFQAVANAAEPVADQPPPRMTVRIDDPWQAEYWRRTNAFRTPERPSPGSLRWVSDALSSHEVTAAILVDQVQSDGADRLVVVGESPLALALCAELAQREREGGVLGHRPRPSFAELVLLGPTAHDLQQRHRLRQERFGNTAPTATIAVLPEPPDEARLARSLEGCAAPAVILAGDPAAPDAGGPSPTLLAAQHPGWTLYAPDPPAGGLVRRPVLERLYRFGLTLEPPAGFPVDSWERAARVVHEAYLRGLGAGRDPNKAAHRPWSELPPFYRASNVRLVTATLAGAEAAGRTWGPVAGAQVSTAVSPGHLEEMARWEHASWCRFYRDQGWRYGPVRDDGRRRHDALRGFDDLSAEYQDRVRGNVRDALVTLHGLGYRSVATGEQRPWQPVARRGEVRARRLDQDWRWQTGSGAWLQARAGDYRVSNGQGGDWSVVAAIFAATYTHIEGDRWRRTGEVQAQPAVAGELVVSLEGPATAAEGDWVIRGAAGEQWLTSAEHFTASYERVRG